MVKAANVVEVEIDGDKNEHLFFRPLQRTLRGRFTLMRNKEPNAVRKMNEYPASIPGKRIGVNLDTKEGYVIEQIHEDSEVKARLEAKKLSFDPPKETFPHIHVDSWLFWMKQAVEADKVARVHTGALPESVDNPTTDYIHGKRKPDAQDKLSASIDRQTTAFEAMAQAFTALANKLSK